MTPELSIIMPTLNQAHYLPSALDSILSQQYVGHVEVVVIDGGSTDGSIEILKSYGDRIRLLSEPDRGQSDAVNKGLSMVRGGIVGWLNSDDLYKPGAFESVYAALQEPNVHWVFGKVDVIDSEGHEIRRWITRIKNQRLRRLTFAKLLRANWISQMGVFWRRDFQRQVGDLELNYHLAMDYDWWLRFWKQSPGTFLDQTIASFRLYAASKSGSAFRRQLDEANAIAVQHAEGGYSADLFRHRMNRRIIRLAYRIGRMTGH